MMKAGMPRAPGEIQRFLHSPVLPSGDAHWVEVRICNIVWVENRELSSFNTLPCTLFFHPCKLFTILSRSFYRIPYICLQRQIWTLSILLDRSLYNTVVRRNIKEQPYCQEFCDSCTFEAVPKMQQLDHWLTDESRRLFGSLRWCYNIHIIFLSQEQMSKQSLLLFPSPLTKNK